MTVDIYGIEDVQVIRQGVSSGGNGPIVGDKNGVIEITQVHATSDLRHVDGF
jgi:hypothetical protein